MYTAISNPVLIDLLFLRLKLPHINDLIAGAGRTSGQALSNPLYLCRRWSLFIRLGTGWFSFYGSSVSIISPNVTGGIQIFSRPALEICTYSQVCQLKPDALGLDLGGAVKSWQGRLNVWQVSMEWIK
jgi:hypothetical protein